MKPSVSVESFSLTHAATHRSSIRSLFTISILIDDGPVFNYIIVIREIVVREHHVRMRETSRKIIRNWKVFLGEGFPVHFVVGSEGREDKNARRSSKIKLFRFRALKTVLSADQLRIWRQQFLRKGAAGLDEGRFADHLRRLFPKLGGSIL